MTVEEAVEYGSGLLYRRLPSPLQHKERIRSRRQSMDGGKTAELSWWGVARMLWVTRGCLRAGHRFEEGRCRCGRVLEAEWIAKEGR